MRETLTWKGRKRQRKREIEGKERYGNWRRFQTKVDGVRQGSQEEEKEWSEGEEKEEEDEMDRGRYTCIYAKGHR